MPGKNFGGRSPACALIPLAAFLLSSCGVSQRYYVKIDQALIQEDYPKALTLMKPEEYGSLNSVLYHLDRGTVLQLAEDFTESSGAFDAADKKMEELYTISVSKEAASFVVNDNTKPYEGEDFEKALVNAFQALNYVWMGELDEALVECRRVNTKLGILNQKYQRKNLYKEDAFVRYLAGMLYEARGEDNDAYISYKKALETYRGDYRTYYGTGEPPWIEEDLRRTGLRSGVLEPESGGPVRRERAPAEGGSGELVVIIFNGFSPKKVEDNLLIPLPGTKVAKVAFPVFSPVPHRTAFVQISVKGTMIGRTVVSEDIEAIAMKNLEDRRARAVLKLGTRQAVKYLISKQIGDVAEREGGRAVGKLVGFLASAALAAAEVADVRSWRTLPAQIQIGKFHVPAGTYRTTLQPVDEGGSPTGKTQVRDIVVRVGKMTFVGARMFN